MADTYTELAICRSIRCSKSTRYLTSVQLSIVSQFEYSKSRRKMSCQRKLASRTNKMDSGFRRNDISNEAETLPAAI